MASHTIQAPISCDKVLVIGRVVFSSAKNSSYVDDFHEIE